MTVNNEYGRLRRVVLCKPDYFKWMPVNPSAKKALAGGQTFTSEDVQEQHKEFANAFRSKGVEVLYIEPDERFVYQIFTRDLGTATREGVLLGSFMLPIRQGEEIAAEKFFVDQGAPILGRLKGLFDGGDISYLDSETLASGLGGRATKESIEDARKVLKGIGLNLITVELPSGSVHLDGKYVRIAEKLCLARVEALPGYFLEMLKERHIEVIDIPVEEDTLLNINVVAIDDKTVVSFKGNINTNAKLKAYGFEVLDPEMSIITQGGGAVHCSCFPLERDEV